MGKLGTFRKLYMFFFMVPFPLFLYYTINGFGGSRFGFLTRPYLALFYLGLSVLLWIYIFGYTFINWKINKPEIKNYFWHVLGWGVLISVVIYYYIFSYNLESNGTGWRFLTFFHPLVLIPIWSIFFVGLMKWGIGLLHNKLPYEKDLLARGIKTTANVVSAQQTGLYINKQPQVRFVLEFTDQNGKTHKISRNRVLSLLNLGMASQKELPIIYLPEDPKKLKIDV